MATSLEESKNDLIGKAAELAAHRKGTGGPPADTVRQFLEFYYRHVAYEDLSGRAEVDLYGAAVSQYKLAAERPQGTANVRVFTPSVSEHGWSAEGHTVVEVVTDDMPFLVDSVTMELNAQGRSVHMVVHPQITVRRDVAGTLQEVFCDDSGSVATTEDHLVARESWMHIEIDRETEADDVGTIVASLQKVLTDVREAVEDWSRMHAQARAIVQDLTDNPPPLPAEEVEEGKALLEWLAEDHFTFLGYREYRLEVADDDEILRAVPGTGYGILRTDQDMSTSFGKLPPLVRAKAREKTLLVLAKANSKATVHRPVYLDYVGVKTFDEKGEVVGERRFLGLFSSSAYTESLTRIPVLRQKAKQVLEESGFDPMSHSGKAMMDVLETYPRDELFQTPLEELVPIAQSVLTTRDRRQLRLFVRRDTYGRYLSCLVYLPRDRYNTTVRERISKILAGPPRRRLDRVHRPRERVPARTSALRHPPEARRADRGLLRRGSAGAQAGRSCPVLAGRLPDRGAQRVRRGGGCPALPGLPRGVPRGLQGGLPAPHRRGRPRPARGHRLRRVPTASGAGTSLSFYQPMDAGQDEARLKVFRIGTPLSLCARAADPLDDGRGGRRRAALRAGGSRAAVLHLRLRAPLQPGHPRGRA